MSATDVIEIGIVDYAGAQMAAILGLSDLFMVADGLARTRRENRSGPQLRISHWKVDERTHVPSRVYDSLEGAYGMPRVLILPPALGAPIEPASAARYAGWLKNQHAAGVILASICAGALVLGEAGALAGRTVTTHWGYGHLLQSRFPEIAHVETDRLLIDDGDIITVGGVMAWTDLGLTLVSRFLGPTVMIDTARQLLVDSPGREQRYYSPFSPRIDHGDQAVLKVQHWLQKTGAKDMSLSLLASQAGLETRTFLRRFQKATGLTSTAYCQRIRIGKAQEMLQFSAGSLERIAWDVGYADASALRKAFVRIVGLSPTEYRQRFRA
ncbi:GlxA family transcriptional regulator [Sphingopyxis sp. R3-92]|uniref:GlxA family transcriptional regulator n=1 Tax=Sphingopyxis sp. R3-92 TaxID=3158553 RepID=UPI003EE72222